jgi:2-keto-4-pentenoate hydratase
MLHTSRLLSYAHLLQAGQTSRGLLEPQALAHGLTREDSQRVLDTMHTLAVADGLKLIGRKMISVAQADDAQSVRVPSLGYLYEQSTDEAEDNAASLKLRGSKQLTVEPKLVFSLGSTPESNDTLQSFQQRFDSVALAIEVLQNPFKGEQWTGEDQVCANGFHHRLVMGEAKTLSVKSRMVFDQIISNATLTLSVVNREGSQIVGFGSGRNNVDQSLQHAYALHQRHVEATGETPFSEGQRIAMGAWLPGKPVAAGQAWIAVMIGVDLPSLCVSFY